MSPRCPACRCELPSTCIDEWVSNALAPRDVTLRLATAEEERMGLLAVCVAICGPLVIDGLAVRLTREDKLIVTWPAKAKRGSRRRIVVRTEDPDFRARSDAVVIRAYLAARAKAGRTGA